jgi:hypothetical protein
VQVVEGLQDPVRFLVFKVEGHPLSQHAFAIEMMLNEYRMKNRKLEVEAVDMQSEPELAQQYNIRIPGSVLLLSGPKTRVLTPEDYIKMEMVGQRPRQVANYEEAITAALIALTRREQFTVYFTIGHDERDTNRAENDGASLLKEALVQDGFLVKATNLLLSGTVPADCDLLVMAGPRGDLFPGGVQRRSLPDAGQTGHLPHRA